VSMCLFDARGSREASGDLRRSPAFPGVEGAPLEIGLPQLSRKEKALLVLSVIFEVIYVWTMLQSQARLL